MCESVATVAILTEMDTDLVGAELGSKGNQSVAFISGAHVSRDECHIFQRLSYFSNKFVILHIQFRKNRHYQNVFLIDGLDGCMFSDPVITAVNTLGDLVGMAIAQRLLDHDLRKIDPVPWANRQQFDAIPTLVEVSHSTLEEAVS